MAWLIGLIAVVVIVVFWRIFLPLGVIALILALGAGAWIYLAEQSSKRERVQAALLRERIIEAAQATASSEGKKWTAQLSPDPASDTKVYRGASIESNDGLCGLRVEKRLNGTELTDLTCSQFELKSYQGDLEVKFNHHAKSYRMELKSYSGGSGVYIPSYQFSGNLPYKDFIKALQTGNAVAFSGSGFGSRWMTFSLNGAADAISKLGTVAKSQETLKP